MIIISTCNYGGRRKPVRQTDLDILLHEGEGSMLEYKESFSSSLARELVAFANSAGDKIILEVRDDRFFTTTSQPRTAQVPHMYRTSHRASYTMSGVGASGGGSSAEIADQEFFSKGCGAWRSNFATVSRQFMSVGLAALSLKNEQAGEEIWNDEPSPLL